MDKDSESKNKKELIENDSIFSKENVNTGHQPEIDYLKALSICIMILSHLNVGYTASYLYLKLYRNNRNYFITFLFYISNGNRYEIHKASRTKILCSQRDFIINTGPII